MHDLYKFEEFRKKFDPVYAAKKAAGSNEPAKPKINWPEDTSSQFNAAAGGDDDDLYD